MSSWYRKIKIAAISDLAKSQIDMMKGEVLDQFVVENWELYLIKTNSPFGIVHQIALQRNDSDFSQQFTKNEVKLPGSAHDVVSGIKNKIQDWLNQYKKLMVSSMSLQKQNKYKSILNMMGFKLEEKIIPGANRKLLFVV